VLGQVRLGQVRSGLVGSGEVIFCWDRLGDVVLGQVRSGRAGSGGVSSSQDGSGDVGVRSDIRVGLVTTTADDNGSGSGGGCDGKGLTQQSDDGSPLGRKIFHNLTIQGLWWII
jgi:hypothetical protein